MVLEVICMIKLTRERIEELLQAESDLNALLCVGVDNWEGYGEAQYEVISDEEIDEYMKGLK